MPARACHHITRTAHDLRADAEGPHLAALRRSEGAISFRHAFAQAPYCAPSRASFFTGRAPARTRVHTFDHEEARRLLPLDGANAWTTLPSAFVAAGYRTHGVGITLATETESARLGRSVWTDGYANVAEEVKRAENHPSAHRLFTGEGVFDSLVAEAALRWLARYHDPRSPAARAQPGHPTGPAAAGLASPPPLFLMAGFWAGHRPYSGAASYWRRYGAPTIPSIVTGEALRWRKPTHTGPFTSPKETIDSARGAWRPLGGSRSTAAWEAVRRGYVANEAKWDGALGVLLEGVRRLRLYNDSVIVLHADHGLSVGEYGVRGKGKLLDVDTRGAPTRCASPVHLHRVSHARI